MTNQERAAEVMETHDLFHFTSGDGWMEPYEDVIRCACGEEFFSYIQTGDGSGDDDRDPNLLYRQHLTQALADAGLLMPDLPAPMRPWDAERTGGEPGSRWYGYEDDGNDDGSGMYSPHRYIDAHPGEVWIDGHVLLAPEGAKAYALAILAAAKLAEEQE